MIEPLGDPSPYKTNWAENFTYSASRLFTPANLGELSELVAGLEQLKVLGTRHCFSGVADTPGSHISLEKFNQIKIKEDATVEVGAGVTYTSLCEALAGTGLALHNMASLPHISVAGACATGTHGSGMEQQCLAAAVNKIQMIKADGSILELRRSDNNFEAAAVNIGALGVVTKLGLDLVPAFKMKQAVYEELSFNVLCANFKEIQKLGYSVSAFTNWNDKNIDQLWVKSRENVQYQDPEVYGCRPATVKLHPIRGTPPASCTPQHGELETWSNILPHFRHDSLPSAGRELQSEYILPIDNAVPAIERLRKIGPKLEPVLFVSEIRTVAGDDLWLSPFYKQDSVAFHFTWRPEKEAVLPLLNRIEAELFPLKARPHWGKLACYDKTAFKAVYGMIPEFRDFARQLDPSGKFSNPFLESTIY